MQKIAKMTLSRLLPRRIDMKTGPERIVDGKFFSFIRGTINLLFRTRNVSDRDGDEYGLKDSENNYRKRISSLTFRAARKNLRVGELNEVIGSVICDRLPLSTRTAAAYRPADEISYLAPMQIRRILRMPGALKITADQRDGPSG